MTDHIFFRVVYCFLSCISPQDKCFISTDLTGAMLSSWVVATELDDHFGIQFWWN